MPSNEQAFVIIKRAPESFVWFGPFSVPEAKAQVARWNEDADVTAQGFEARFVTLNQAFVVGSLS